MKNILIFSNPFGNGPLGKAISIAKHIAENSDQSTLRVFLCSSIQLGTISNEKFNFISLNDRNEKEITKVLHSMDGINYIISSQNRFAIKVAKEHNIPSAFLDGLSWFWKTIPDEHFSADIIFWLNYRDIADKIPPLHSHKIKIIHGITEKPNTDVINLERKGNFLLYLGGCNNPLTPLPIRYLDLFAELIKHITTKGVIVDIATDHLSQEYLKKYPELTSIIKTYSHDDFLKKLSQGEKFITNGGQTAILEAYTTETPISFFLPINLSQYALIRKLKNSEGSPHLDWSHYVKVPKMIFDYNEKDAITFFDQSAHLLLQDKIGFNKLCKDFLAILITNGIYSNDFLKDLGSTGAHDILTIIKEKWGI